MPKKDTDKSRKGWCCHGNIITFIIQPNVAVDDQHPATCAGRGSGSRKDVGLDFQCHIISLATAPLPCIVRGFLASHPQKSLNFSAFLCLFYVLIEGILPLWRELLNCYGKHLWWLILFYWRLNGKGSVICAVSSSLKSNLYCFEVYHSCCSHYRNVQESLL